MDLSSGGMALLSEQAASHGPSKSPFVAPAVSLLTPLTAESFGRFDCAPTEGHDARTQPRAGLSALAAAAAARGLSVDVGSETGVEPCAGSPFALSALVAAARNAELPRTPPKTRKWTFPPRGSLFGMGSSRSGLEARPAPMPLSSAAERAAPAAPAAAAAPSAAPSVASPTVEVARVAVVLERMGRLTVAPPAAPAAAPTVAPTAAPAAAPTVAPAAAPAAHKLASRPAARSRPRASFWVACDRCDKWRRLPSEGRAGRPASLPPVWYCWMHPNPAARRCEDPEEVASEDEVEEGQASEEGEGAEAAACVSVGAEDAVPPHEQRGKPRVGRRTSARERRVRGGAAAATEADEEDGAREAVCRAVSEQQRCGNTLERAGGAFGCLLPAGHAGPHQIVQPGRRARKVEAPPALAPRPRPLSAYQLFMKDEVARLKASDSEISHKEAFKEAARNWGTADANPQKRAMADATRSVPAPAEGEGGAARKRVGGGAVPPPAARKRQHEEPPPPPPSKEAAAAAGHVDEVPRALEPAGRARAEQLAAGTHVRVLWEGGEWYAGRFKGHSSARGHCVAYDDGDVRYHRLEDEVWEIEGHTSVGDANAAHSSSGGGGQGAATLSAAATSSAATRQKRRDAPPEAPRRKQRRVEEGGEVDVADSGGAAPLLDEMEGVRLHLSSTSNTGYRGVHKRNDLPGTGKPYIVKLRSTSSYFATAVEAALYYARSSTGAGSVGGGPSSSATQGAPPKDEALAESDSRAAPEAEAPTRNAWGGMAKVRPLLEGLGLLEYAAAFDAAGYDDDDFLLSLDGGELAEAAAEVGMRADHARRFVREVGALPRAPPRASRLWA